MHTPTNLCGLYTVGNQLFATLWKMWNAYIAVVDKGF